MKKHQFNENSHATAMVSYLLPSLSLPPPPLPPKNYLFINTRSQIDKLYLKQKVSTESVSTLFFIYQFLGVGKNTNVWKNIFDQS